MHDNSKGMRIMKRRGRPRKSKTDNSPIRKPKTLRLSDEEKKYISGNAQRCKMNFSEYCRKVLLNYKPSVPDSKFRDELIAARRDIVNFANNIKKLQTDQEKRKQLLQSMPVIQKWWKSLFSLVEFLDKKIERA